MNCPECGEPIREVSTVTIVKNNKILVELFCSECGEYLWDEEISESVIG